MKSQTPHNPYIQDPALLEVGAGFTIGALLWVLLYQLGRVVYFSVLSLTLK